MENMLSLRFPYPQPWGDGSYKFGLEASSLTLITVFVVKLDEEG